jgi:UDP-2,3-diacylglucosamine hydrolase
MSIYLISDLHISTLADSRRIVALLTHFEQDPMLEAIFLVGDVFEFNLAYSNIIFDSYFPLIAKLDALIQKQVKIHLFSGNHDPGINPIFKQIGVICHHQPVDFIFKDFKLKLHIEHGDLIDSAKIKKLFCQFVRHPWVQILAQCIPAQWLFRITQKLSTHPIQRTQAPNIPQVLISKVMQTMQDQQIDIWVMGHFHRLLHLNHEGKQIFVLGDGILYMSYLKISLETAKLGPMLQIPIDSSDTNSSDTNSSNTSISPMPTAQIFRYLKQEVKLYAYGDHDF